MNHNCLAGIRCPECGSEGPFEMVVAASATMSDEGSEDVRDISWEPESPIACVGCGNRGRVAEFSGKQTMLAALPVTIPDSAWEDWGVADQERERSRLGTSLSINHCHLHVEAIEVTVGNDGVQRAADPYWEDSLGEWFVASGSDGHLSTVSIGEREYAVFLSPFCQ